MWGALDKFFLHKKQEEKSCNGGEDLAISPQVGGWQLDPWNGKWHPNFFQQSSRIMVNLLSYESKATDKREQYDWRAEKNWTGSWVTVFSYNTIQDF